MYKVMVFCHLQEHFEINIVKDQWILQQKQEQMLQKLLLKEQLKTVEATRDLTGSKIANKITSASKSKYKENEDQTNEI